MVPSRRSALGMFSCSSVYGNGVSKPQTRSTGASRCCSARSQIAAMSSAAKPQVRGASWAMTLRPVSSLYRSCAEPVVPASGRMSPGCPRFTIAPRGSTCYI